MYNKIYVGDNLIVMKSKDFSEYTGKIDFIYIDPPYNTTNNTLTFYDNNNSWVNDISERLQLAKNFMSESGVIFISIDDNELSNLLSACYLIFGKENYIGLFITKQSQRSNAKHINVIHEYILAFAKNKKNADRFYIRRLENPTESVRINSLIQKVKAAFKKSQKEAVKELKEQIEKYVKETGETWIKNYSNIDENGNIFFAKDLSVPGKPNRLDIDEIGLHLEPLKTRGWSSKEKILSLYKDNRLCYKKGRPYAIEYIEEATNNVSSILDFYSRQGTNDLKKMGLSGLFATPKPVELIKFLIRCSMHKDSLILDFYAGSVTTAQAVYEINKEDNTNHKYVLIQLEEEINKKSDAFLILKQKGYENPTVDKAMLVRINTFLELNKLAKDYVIERLTDDGTVFKREFPPDK